MAQIVVEDLRKRFVVAERRAGMLGALAGVVRRRHRVVEALAGVGFRVDEGELVGYIGPNGAGKSTTVKVLAGILVPDGGRCEVQGRVPWLERVEHVARIGVVFGQRTQLWWDLPVVESFELLREIYRVDRQQYRVRLDALVNALDVGAVLDVPVRQLSLGQRMRCDVVAALLHAPQLLFLDEPTIGLDAPAKLAVREFVRRLNRERGTTVILTTHDMDDIEALCSRVVVIDHGRISCDGSLDHLRERAGVGRRIIVDLERDEPLAPTDARVVSREGTRVVLAFDPVRTPAAALVARITREHAVRDLFVENPPIEEIVARLYGEADARGEAEPRPEPREDPS
ncbi:ABC transporter ATP-binding protein [Paraliomyxa miuraensis]|uniref:ABC transporter ATP-binding protein n=1 Tax=Paraliomyxa miuraensis TaxID=376150 RepID=UPI002254A924|nr:ATP-binding cassette domain-containing protein [Paraliomyxa miuraensis]MCX4241668.1 ATP-binding cassette domain-containing protein [Paraliomyxa miuraensis]